MLYWTFSHLQLYPKFKMQHFKNLNKLTITKIPSVMWLQMGMFLLMIFVFLNFQKYKDLNLLKGSLLAGALYYSSSWNLLSLTLMVLHFIYGDLFLVPKSFYSLCLFVNAFNVPCYIPLILVSSSHPVLTAWSLPLSHKNLRLWPKL